MSLLSVEAMIAQAEKSLGTHESNGNNTNHITAWYGLNGAPWCDQAVSYWAWHSGNQGPVCGGGKFAYTVTHAQWFKDHGRWHTDIAGIRRGDIVFFDWDGSNSIAAIDHVGIVTGTDGATVFTIEGNIGDVCARKVRYADTIAGYGRPAYTGPSTQAAPPPARPGRPVVYEPFPGANWFKGMPHSPVVTATGKRLVVNHCGRYSVGPGPDWSDADRESYAAWQRRCGFSGTDANGWPGRTSWDKLKVPRS